MLVVDGGEVAGGGGIEQLQQTIAATIEGESKSEAWIVLLTLV